MIDGVLFLKGNYDYGEKYYDEYMRREQSISGIVLNTLRVNLVKRYAKDSILDIGCGAGSFIKYMWSDNCIKTMGYDVNLYTVKWLKDKNIYFNVKILPVTVFDTITFFDSFEHIEDHDAILGKMRKGARVVISIPVFEDLVKIEDSKHYKPGEHLWYFTHDGICTYMHTKLFVLLESTDMEQSAGREDIMTYVFEKI